MKQHSLKTGHIITSVEVTEDKLNKLHKRGDIILHIEHVMKEGAGTLPPIAKVKKRARNISSDYQVATRVAQISNSVSSKRPKLLSLKDKEEPNIA